MSGPIRGLIVCAILATALLGASPLPAQVILKPNGQNAVPLRSKALLADVTIDGQFATTKLVMTFQNETSERIEADFLYTLPLNTIVTYFAYWYGQEKVVAHIVEKEEAAAIYAHITARMHDPALVEMIGKNTFRARIFPVMPNSDLKVEMTWMETLPSDRPGARYVFPLQMEKGHTLESLQFHVHVKADPSLAQVSDNYGLPMPLQRDGYHFTLAGTNYRPPKDLLIHLKRKSRPLQTELVAAPSGGQDGFFALALTPDSPLRRPMVRISGVATYQVLPAAFPNVNAYHALTLFGRYKGSGPAQVTLMGEASAGRWMHSAPVVFGGAHEPGNIASKLWAAHRIEQFGSQRAGRATVIALSKQFSLPSRFTSWLAVPKEEMERYRTEKAEAQIEVVARRLAREISRRRENGDTARQLRLRLNALCRQVGSNPKEALRSQLSSEISDLGQSLAMDLAAGRQKSSEARRLRARLNFLCRQTGTDPKEALRDGLQGTVDNVAESLAKQITLGNSARALRERLNWLCQQTGQHPLQILQSQLEGQTDSIGQTLAHEYAYGNPQGASARNLQARLRILCRETGENIRQVLSNHLPDAMADLANRLVEIQYAYPSNRAKQQALRGRLDYLARVSGQDASSYLAGAETTWLSFHENAVRDQLYAEHHKAQPDQQRIRRLEQDFLATHRRMYGSGDAQQAEQDARTRLQRLAVKADLEKVDQMLDAARGHSDSVRLTGLEQRRSALQKQEEALRARMGDPLIHVEAPADAQQVVALLPGGEIKRLVFNAVRRRWEARFDIPAYAREGEYVITIIIVLKDGTRRLVRLAYHVDLTPPTGAGSAQFVPASVPMLRLEIEGSEDTARVVALLPWGAKTVLTPSARPHHFFALAPIPAGQQGIARVVTFVLTDKAHNRTVVTVDMMEP